MSIWAAAFHGIQDGPAFFCADSKLSSLWAGRPSLCPWVACQEFHQRSLCCDTLTQMQVNPGHCELCLLSVLACDVVKGIPGTHIDKSRPSQAQRDTVTGKGDSSVGWTRRPCALPVCVGVRTGVSIMSVREGCVWLVHCVGTAETAGGGEQVRYRDANMQNETV